MAIAFLTNGGATETMIVTITATKSLAVNLPQSTSSNLLAISSITESHIKPKDCKLEDDLFLCANNQTCLKLSQFCDNTIDCPDKSDEGHLCTSTHNCTTLKCSHKCKQMPSGPTCICPKGYSMIDEKTCVDINECNQYGICDQKCRNTQGSYECYCDNKYILDKDKRNCKAIGGEAMMVFSSKTEIRGYFLESELYFPMVKHLKQVVGVGFDGHHIYWTDIFSEHESIVRSLEDGSEREVNQFCILLFSYSAFKCFS